MVGIETLITYEKTVKKLTKNKITIGALTLILNHFYLHLIPHSRITKSQFDHLHKNHFDL